MSDEWALQWAVLVFFAGALCASTMSNLMRDVVWRRVEVAAALCAAACAGACTIGDAGSYGLLWVFAFATAVAITSRFEGVS